MPPIRSSVLACALLVVATTPLFAAGAEPVLPPSKAYQTPDSWRQPVPAFRIAERTWYIGTAGLSALLVKTDAGAVLIDGGMPQVADMLLQRMRDLGVAPSDLKLILHSHAHADHAGPLAAVQRATGARLLSNAESAVLLARGGSNDLHFGDGMLYPVPRVDRLLMDGEAVELGGMRFTVHFTPAHTPGSMSWSWNDTRHDTGQRDGMSLRIAYVDSVSAPDYQLIDNPRYPRIVDDYRRGFAAVRALPCDLLLTPHPDASGWAPAATAKPHPSPMSCRAYADRAERALEAQIEKQREALALMPYTPIVATLGYVLSPDGRGVLLVHRNARADDAHLGKYNGLGGKIEPDEDVLAGMRREIHEEAGIHCEQMSLRGTISWPGFGKHGEDWLGFVFVVTQFSGTPFESNPEGTLEWVPLDRIDALPMWEGDRQFLPLVFDADPRPFHGVMPYRDGRMVSWRYSRM